MINETRNPQINISKIPVGGDAGGLIAAIAAVLIVMIGMPFLWGIALVALILGGAVALTLHFTRRRNPGEPWILPATKK